VNDRPKYFNKTWWALVVFITLGLLLYYLTTFKGVFLFDFAPHYAVGKFLRNGQTFVYDFVVVDRTERYVTMFPGEQYLAAARELPGFPEAPLPQYPYSPALFPFCLFVSLWPVSVLFPLVMAVNIMLWVGCVVWPLRREGPPDFFAMLLLVLATAVAAFGDIMHFNILSGQVNIALLSLTLAAAMLAERDKEALAGVVLGLAATAKFFPAVLLIPWLIRGRWRAAVWTIAVTVVLTALGFLIAGGEITRGFLAISRVQGQSPPSIWFNQSPDAFFLRATLPFIDLFGFRFYFARWSYVLPALAFKAVVLGVGAWLAMRVKAGESADNAASPWWHLPEYYFICAGAIMLPQAWTHYFVFTIPLTLYCALLLWRGANSRVRAWGLIALALLTFAIHVPQDWAVVFQLIVESAFGGRGYAAEWLEASILRLIFNRFFISVALLLFFPVWLFRLDCKKTILTTDG
jgi:hypothetical protein